MKCLLHIHIRVRTYTIKTEVTTALCFITFMCCEIKHIFVLDHSKMLKFHIAFVHFSGLQIPFNKFSLLFFMFISFVSVVVLYIVLYIGIFTWLRLLVACCWCYFIAVVVRGALLVSLASYSCWFFWLKKDIMWCASRTSGASAQTIKQASNRLWNRNEKSNETIQIKRIDLN